MLKAGLKNLAEHLAKRYYVDPKQFQDPMALKTEWTPLSQEMTSSWKSHKLYGPDQGQMRFKPTWPSFIMILPFFIVGLAGCGFILSSLFFGAQSLVVLPFIVIPLAFVLVAWLALKTLTEPIVFDIRSGWFWKGREAPSYVVTEQEKDWVRLDDLVALQLLRAPARSSSNSRVRGDIYQINLVLKDGSRINVIGHGGRVKAIRDEARRLSHFLSCPLWDATAQNFDSESMFQRAG